MRMQTMAGEADTAVRDQLVMEHVGLVKAMASRLANRLPPQVEVSELVSVGVLGLIDAAGRFRPSLGVPFSAFARRRIHGAMLDSLRGLDWAPRAVRKLRRDVDAAIANLRFELGREPESADIARALDVSESEYEKMLDRLKVAELASIRQSSVGEDGRTALDVEIEPSEGPHARLEREEMRRLLAQAITDLPDRERHILALYYEEELTLAEIGEVIGVGESRVSQLRSQAIARLRSALATRMTRKDAA
jgi:RNA polymerase sigma factor for flagellar operon FliA